MGTQLAQLECKEHVFGPELPNNRCTQTEEREYRCCTNKESQPDEEDWDFYMSVITRKVQGLPQGATRQRLLRHIRVLEQHNCSTLLSSRRDYRGQPKPGGPLHAEMQAAFVSMGRRPELLAAISGARLCEKAVEIGLDASTTYLREFTHRVGQNNALTWGMQAHLKWCLQAAMVLRDWQWPEAAQAVPSGGGAVAGTRVPELDDGPRLPEGAHSGRLADAVTYRPTMPEELIMHILSFV